MESKHAIEILNNRKHLAYRGDGKEVWVHSLTNVEVDEIAALIERQERIIKLACENLTTVNMSLWTAEQWREWLEKEAAK